MVCIRKYITNERQKLDVFSQANGAWAITNQLLTTTFFRLSKKIAVYFPVHGEIDTFAIIKKIWEEDKMCYLPVVAIDTLSFHLYTQQSKLIKNKFNIPEPIPNEKTIILPHDLDLVVVPVIGFDEKCNRMGSGKGFYDRTFNFKKPHQPPFLIGIAYDFQKMNFDLNPWDIPMDMIITEMETYSLYPVGKF